MEKGQLSLTSWCGIEEELLRKIGLLQKTKCHTLPLSLEFFIESSSRDESNVKCLLLDDIRNLFHIQSIFFGIHHHDRLGAKSSHKRGLSIAKQSYSLIGNEHSF